MRCWVLGVGLLLGAALAKAEAGTAAHFDLCDKLAARLRSVDASLCRAEAFVAADARTVQGNPLVHVDKGEQAAATVRIFVIGGIHGDELTSVSLVFRWLPWLEQPEAAAYQWRLIPVANPDGLLLRRPTRVNARGVDLNRNFATPDWDADAHKYWRQRTRSDPRRSPGPQAASEVETRWLQQQIEEFRPDLIISLHAPYNLLDYDGPVPQPLRFGRLSLKQLGVYPGSMGNYAGLVRQIPVITIELPHATQMPSAQEQRSLWSDLLLWVKENIRPAGASAAPG